MMIKSRQLIQFLEIAKQGRSKAGARELNLYPAFSRSIQGLKAQLGVKLFDRGIGMVKLTVFGEALFPRASTIVNSLIDTNQLIEYLKCVETRETNQGGNTRTM